MFVPDVRTVDLKTAADRSLSFRAIGLSLFVQLAAVRAHSAVFGSPTFFHIDMNCIPAHSERVSSAT